MKKNICIVLVATILISMLSGCERTPEYTKFEATFFDTFDTITQIVGYAKTEEEFNEYVNIMHDRFMELHKLYDKYKSYEGVNNIKTINDNAGISPVEVSKEILDLIIFSKEMYHEISPKTNIAMGAVLEIWSEYREEASADPSSAEIPPMEILQAANEHTDIEKVIVDMVNSTVYLQDPRMKLDVGAVAKGYATEVVAKEAEAAGFISGIISAGGNVRTIGKPLDGVRERWGIGIQNPDAAIFGNGDNVLETIFINDASVVSSGDYQRYYVVEDKVIHHLIDPDTLMPGDYFRAVSVVIPHSGEADFLSTVIFLMPYEEGKRLIEGIEGARALWVLKDGTVEATEGMKKIMKSHGATGAVEE